MKIRYSNFRGVNFGVVSHGSQLDSVIFNLPKARTFSCSFIPLLLLGNNFFVFMVFPQTYTGLQLAMPLSYTSP